MRGPYYRRVSISAALLLALSGYVCQAVGQQFDLSFPIPAPHQRINFAADQIQTWRQGAYFVYHLNGNAAVAQGRFKMQSQEAIVWLDPGDPDLGGLANVIIYAEQGVDVGMDDGHVSSNDADPPMQYQGDNWFGRLSTKAGVELKNAAIQISPDNAPPIFGRGLAKREGEYNHVEPVQFVESTPQQGASVISPITGAVQQTGPGVPLNNAPIVAAPAPQPNRPRNQGLSHVEILPRNDSESGFKTIRSQVPGEEILVYTHGARINIDSVEVTEISGFGQPTTKRLVIQADNAIAWKNTMAYSDGTAEDRYEFYLEGNVIFATGDRVVYADRVYYDTAFKRGTILNADMLTPIPSYRGLVRLKADVLQQLSDNTWQAHRAALTSSRLGVPRYWLQSDVVTVTRTQERAIDENTGYPLVDGMSGQPILKDSYFSESNDNLIYVGNVPVFYWPFLRTDLDDPSYYIERIRIGQDNIYGFQFGVGLDMYQVLGLRNPPDGTKWTGIIDYLSDRGTGFGSDFEYERNSFWGIQGPTEGFIRAWFIDDKGLDNLGRDRRRVPLEEDFRGRVLGQHRQKTVTGWDFKGEIGWISDVNFLQQYYEREWDTYKDATTGFNLERLDDNESYNLIVDGRINDFFTQTNWLPRLDHFIVGQSLFFDRAVWHGHSTISYAQFNAAEAPTNPIDSAKFDPLAWEVANTQGAVAATRQEIDFPFQVGVVKVVPYALGEVGYWQEDLALNDYFRAAGQTGIRASMPMWQVDPTIQSTLLNLNGVAHKIILETEFAYADASQDMLGLPLYNSLDDDSQEFFRRRFAFDTFGIVPGGDVPLPFDERTFAYRSGLQSYATSPNMEIFDDQMVIRTGINNRWQTKRGLPGEARIIDWITFDVRASIFPRADRDNFGEDVGLVDYDFSWHIGNRFTVVSDGYFDFFTDGLQTVSLGTYYSRPSVLDLYIGMRSIEGPISSNVLSTALTYRMSDKWIVRGNSAVDFKATGNIGQSISFIRVGESFLLRAGVNADISRGNVGFIFGFEPRFLPNGRLGRVAGVRIPPAGSRYLE